MKSTKMRLNLNVRIFQVFIGCQKIESIQKEIIEIKKVCEINIPISFYHNVVTQ